MIEKRRRQTALLRIVREHSAGSQRELIRLLQKAGFTATQASVSRDLRELGLVKVDGRYRRLPRPGRTDAVGATGPFSELVTSMQPIGAHLILLHTRVGAAPTVAIEIDALHADEIAGTLAGDDTILIAVRSRAAQGRAVARLQRLRGTP
jgi:transcriptional regulator of arginine metabolism